MQDLMSTARADRHALLRVVHALERAESELPQLAAPDGTVAVQIDDLRAVISQMDRMRDMLALGRRPWIERWYGSEPQRGSAICVATKSGGHGEQLAYLGGDENTHKAVQNLVAAHNSAFIDRLDTPEAIALADIEQLRAFHGAVLICPDDEEATSADRQTAVDCTGDWTNWEERRFYGATIPDALAKAAAAQAEWSQRPAT